jgi:hypothetical protein
VYIRPPVIVARSPRTFAVNDAPISDSRVGDVVNDEQRIDLNVLFQGKTLQHILGRLLVVVAAAPVAAAVITTRSFRGFAASFITDSPT